jgi:hypothetical protein
MGQEELATSDDDECENCEQQDTGVSTDQTAQVSTAHEGPVR